MIRIVNIEVASFYCLLVEFTDGEIKKIDISNYLDKGVFQELKSKEYFSQVKNFGYFISWPNQQELSADTLYFS